MVDLAGSARLAAGLGGLEGELRGLCASVEPEDLLARHAVALVETAAAMERLLCGARTLAVLRVLESKAWRDGGHRSPQRWLAATLGVSVGQAGRIVATAERVRSQPQVADALRDGALSDEEADAVSETIAADPAGEAEHLFAATGGTHGRPHNAPGGGGGGEGGGRPGGSGGAGGQGGPAGEGADPAGPGGHEGGTGDQGAAGDSGPSDGPGQSGGDGHGDGGPGGSASGGDGPGGWGSGGDGPAAGGGRRESLDELRRRRARAKAKADADEAARQARVHRDRTAWRGPSDEGGYSMRMHTTAEAGLRFDQAWDAAIAEIRAERRAAGLEPLLYGQLCADALIRLADHTLHPNRNDGTSTGTAAGGGSAGGGGAGSGSSRGGMGLAGVPGPKANVLLLVDAACLRRGHREGDELCEIPGVGPVSVRVAKDLLGDAAVSIVIRDGQDVASVTSFHKTIPTALRTAVWARAHGHCEIPGCTVRTGLEIDHDHERQHLGPTSLANLSLKCWQHHQDKTHHGWRLIGPPGRRAWTHLDHLPADPAHGPLPQDDIEHLLPPPTPQRAGPAPPAAADTRPGPGDAHPPAATADSGSGSGDQLHLLDA